MRHPFKMSHTPHLIETAQGGLFFSYYLFPPFLRKH